MFSRFVITFAELAILVLPTLDEIMIWLYESGLLKNFDRNDTIIVFRLSMSLSSLSFIQVL